LQFLDKWGAPGTGNGEFNEPSGMAVAPNGDLYVADRGNHRIQVFSSTGTFITAWGDSGAGNGQFDAPQDVAIDANGDVYVADDDNHRIQVFTSTGTYLRQWGGFGISDGQFKGPRGIAVDDSFHVFVSENGLPNKRVQKFTSTGTFLAKWGSLGTANGQFQSPRGVSIDEDGTVLVVDAVSNRVQRFTTMGTFVDTWGSAGSGDGEFNFPTGIACGPGLVYVSDPNNHRFQAFDLNSSFQGTWGSECDISSGTGCDDPDGDGPLESGDGQFNFPLGVAADASGSVYVADTENHRIQKFGRPATSGTGPDDSQLGTVTLFPNPTRGTPWMRLALDPGPSVLARDFRLQARIYDGSGRLVREIFDGTLPPGSHALRWDGTSHLGQEVPSGVYFLDVQVDGDRWRLTKIVRLP
jgi:sugar lactone lactonase YvrE